MQEADFEMSTIMLIAPCISLNAVSLHLGIEHGSDPIKTDKKTYDFSYLVIG